MREKGERDRQPETGRHIQTQKNPQVQSDTLTKGIYMYMYTLIATHKLSERGKESFIVVLRRTEASVHY